MIFIKEKFKKQTKVCWLLFLFIINSNKLPALSMTPPQALIKERSISSAKIALFAQTGVGDFYTLYPEGLKKEDAKIGGFKSAQLDPIEENIYFFDPELKVIAKINLKDGKVYKVLGKPRSNENNVDYKDEVSFENISLKTFKDFTIDKYGNIFILVSQLLNDGRSVDKIIKASLKNKKAIEVFNESSYFSPLEKMKYSYTFDLDLKGLTVNNDDLFLYGSTSYKRDGYQYFAWDSSDPNNGTSSVIIKFNPLLKSVEIFGAKQALSQIEISPKVLIKSDNFNDNNYLQSNTPLKIEGLFVDSDNSIYLSRSDIENGTTNSRFVKTDKLSSSFVFEQFIGENKSTSEPGDGGSAKSAYAFLSGSKFILKDKNGDFYIADQANNKIRKIFAESGLITSVIGGGDSEISKFDDVRDPFSVKFKSPNSIFVDKSNTLYIIQPDKIFSVKDLVERQDQPIQLVKVASLFISKIAGKEILDPKGEINIPDLKLDYTFAGNQNVEVKGHNIPEGTNIKILDGSGSLTPPSAKINGGIANVQLNIEAGKTKVIKAETDPFIPAPGVYLPENAPVINPGEYAQESNNTSSKRGDVNLSTKDTQGNIIENLIPPGQRFNFSKSSGWSRYYPWDGGLVTKQNSTSDPDSVIGDGTLVEFTGAYDTLYLPVQNSAGMTTFSIWMKSDGGNINVPVGISKYCPEWRQSQSYNLAGWDGCRGPEFFNSANFQPFISYVIAAVTPEWQKFTVTSNANNESQLKTLLLGNFIDANKKIYIWGARLEKSQ